MTKTLLTGASGFIGGHIARYFNSKDVELICYVRKNSDLSFIKDLPVKIVYGDINDLDKLSELSVGVDCIIHTAARASDWGDYEHFLNTNVNGTLNVLRACSKNNIRKVIITGSISSYGEENCYIKKDEEFPYNSHYKYFMSKFFPCKMNYYRDTKALSTRKAVEYASEKDMNLTVVEPVWVYGENEFNTGFFKYMKTTNTGIPFFPGSKKNKFHVIYAGDLARFYYMVYKKDLKGINRIIAGNKEVDYMDRIYSLFCHELGRKKPVNTSKALIYPLALLMELFFTLFRTKNPPSLTRGRVNMFYDNIEYSTNKAEKLFGFNNEYTLEEGINRTVSWYKNNGYL